MARFRSHEDRIIEAAVDALFPLPTRPDPRVIEGMLTGYAGALDAIGSTATVHLTTDTDNYTAATKHALTQLAGATR